MAIAYAVEVSVHDLEVMRVQSLRINAERKEQGKTPLTDKQLISVAINNVTVQMGIDA